MAAAYDESPDGILLQLSPDEARVLRDILDMIGGDPTISRRRFTEEIRRALSGLVP